MKKRDLEDRTKKFAVEVIQELESLPSSYAHNTLARQVLRSATSIGANYREANRSQSRADFVHHLSRVEKEAAESEYWLELLTEAFENPSDRLRRLRAESRELLKIFASARFTALQKP